MKRIVFAVHTQVLLGFFYNCFHIFLPATVALIWVNSALVVLAITFARVVLPVPGGP